MADFGDSLSFEPALTGGPGRRAGLAARLLLWSASRPRLILCLWGLVTLACVPALLNLRVDTSTDNVLDRESPEWAFYQESQESFGGDEILVVAVSSETPFSPVSLRRIDELTDPLQRIEGVRRVDGLSTVPLIRTDSGGNLELDAALGSGLPTSQGDLEHLRRAIASDRIARGNFVSGNEQTFALNVLLEENLGTRFEEVVTKVRRLVEESGAWVSGVPVFRTEINIKTGSEISFFVVVTLILIAGLVALVFSSAHTVLCILSVGSLGTIVTLAALGASDTPLTLSTMILPSVVLALGCAYSMHAVTAAARDQGALDDKLPSVAAPIALSGLTTAAGFISISLIRIEAIRDVGLFGALGVATVTVATLTWVPALMALRNKPPLAPRCVGWILTSLRPAIVRACVSFTWGIFGTASAVTLAFGLGLSNLELETDATRWFPVGSEIRDSYEEIRARLAGISPMNVVLRSTDQSSLLEPQSLAAIDALSSHLEGLAWVGRSISVADPLRQLNGEILRDASRPLPGDRNAAEQGLILLESMEPLRDLISTDHSEANILLRVNNNGSKHLIAIHEEVGRWWRDHGVPGVDARATGIMYEFARAQDAISAGQIRGLAFALASVTIALLAVLKSFRLAVLALVPNLLPIVIGFGLMGWIGEPLDAATIVAGSLALGIAVDDTLHVVVAWQDSHEAGASAIEAVSEALSQVLPALMFTTVVVGLGFMALAFSVFSFTRNLGMLVTGVLLVCLVADALLLPALLAKFGEPREVQARSAES